MASSRQENAQMAGHRANILKIRNCFHYSITSGNDAVLHQQHEIRKICGSNQQNKHTDMDQDIQMILEGKIAESTIKIEPKLY